MQKQAMPANLGKMIRMSGSALRHSPRLELAAGKRIGTNATGAMKWLANGFKEPGEVSGALPQTVGSDISHIVNNPGTAGTTAPGNFGASGFPKSMGGPAPEGVNAPMSIPRTLRPTAMPGADLQKMHQLGFGMKQANIMNNTTTLSLALALNEEMTKQATAGAIERGLGALRGMAGRVGESVAPKLESGFGALGGQAFRHIPEGSLPAKALFGNGGIVPRLEQGEETWMDLPALGKTIAKRTGIGAGAAAGATLAAEAPFKAQNNAQYEDQQQHPIRSWLQQHVGGRKPLQHQSYLNPMAI